MKRYKVTLEDEDYQAKITFHIVEEVKEEEECEGDPEEWRDPKWICSGCKICKDYKKDQPLTPKDVGLGEVEALGMFMDWYVGNNQISVWSLRDEEFDRLYQQFLKEKLTDK